MVGNTPCTLSLFIVATVNRLQNRCHLWIDCDLGAMSLAQPRGEHKAKLDGMVSACFGPKQFSSSGITLFPSIHQNLVKPPRRRFLDYVVDSLGEINAANVTVLPFAA